MKLSQFPKLAMFHAGSLAANSVPDYDMSLRLAGETEVAGTQEAKLEPLLASIEDQHLYEYGMSADAGIDVPEVPAAVYKWLDQWY